MPSLGTLRLEMDKPLYILTGTQLAILLIILTRLNQVLIEILQIIIITWTSSRKVEKLFPLFLEWMGLKTITLWSKTYKNKYHKTSKTKMKAGSLSPTLGTKTRESLRALPLMTYHWTTKILKTWHQTLWIPRTKPFCNSQVSTWLQRTNCSKLTKALLTTTQWALSLGEIEPNSTKNK